MFTQKTPISGCHQKNIGKWAGPVLFVDFQQQYFQLNGFKTIFACKAYPP